MIKCGPTAFDGVLDGVQKQVVAEWLCQELDCSCLHGLDRHRDVTVSCDENDRHVDPIDDAFLEIEAVEVGKINVEYQATRSKSTWARLCGLECLWLPALVADQQFERFAY